MNDIKVEELEPRNLQTKDLFRVATILSKCGDKLMETIKKTTGIEGEKNVQVFGAQMYTVILSVAESEIKPFLADLVGMKAEQFDTTPYDTSLVIIEKLAKKEDLPAFFQRASKLAGIFKPLGKKQTS